MIRPIYIFIVCVILMYVVMRFRALDERLNIMRRSLDGRVTDADVGNMIDMVRDHLGADMETRVEELSVRIDLIEEKLPRTCLNKNFEFSGQFEDVSPSSEDPPPGPLSAEDEEEDEEEEPPPAPEVDDD